MQYEEFSETDYEYERRMKRREREIYERRRRKKRKQQIKRMVILFAAFCVVVAVAALIIPRDEKPENMDDSGIVTVSEELVTPVSETMSEDVSEYTQPTPFEEKPQTMSTESVNIDGVMIFEGYSAQKSDSYYYIDSEEMQSTYALLLDAGNGQIVCGKNYSDRINPASMTKILTVLVAAEHLSPEDLDKEITVTLEDTDYAYVNDLSAVNFNAGETVTVRDLFYGTILPSGADAAIALARYTAGDEDTFVSLMNDKLNELGLSNTSHMTNCVGLYDDNHYSTCYDIAMMLKAAVENEFCREVLNAHTYTTSFTPEHPEGITISNWFLRRIEDKDTNGEVMYAKTGYVVEAGSCGASFMISNNKNPYICVTADAHSAWRCIYDHVDIYKNNTK